jgi:hypothetical protein
MRCALTSSEYNNAARQSRGSPLRTYWLLDTVTDHARAMWQTDIPSDLQPLNFKSTVNAPTSSRNAGVVNCLPSIRKGIDLHQHDG